MTRKALHSAILEVGLFFEKGWSADRIAHFTYWLRRRRVHAADAAARAGEAPGRGIPAEQLTAGFAIPEGRASKVAIKVAASKPRSRKRASPVSAASDSAPEAAASAADPAANEALVARVRAGLNRRPARERSALGFLCAVCGEPATGWTRIDGFADGKPVIDGYATCVAHRSPEAVEQLLVTRAR